MAPAPIASQPSRITEPEQTFALAIAEKKLRDVDEEELKKALRYVFMVVGIRGQNIPTGVEKEFLHAYIVKHFGGHTPAEIRQAFDMAVQGQLDLDPRDVKCYENFSVMYFSTIMRAYRIWAVEQAHRLDRQAEPPPMTDEQKAQIDREYLDYLAWVAFQRQREIDKLPSTIKRLRSCKKEQ